MPVGPIGWAVWLRHMIGLLNYLTVHLEEKYSLLNTWQQKTALHFYLLAQIVFLYLVPERP